MTEEEFEKYFTQIDSEYATGNQLKAYELTRRLLEVDSTHPRALHIMGCLHADSDRYTDAIECFEASAQNGGEQSALPLYNLGNVHKEAEDWGRAADAYQRALEADPSMFDAWINLGYVIDISGSHEEALACYEVAEKIEDSAPVVYSSRGNSLRLLGRYEEALASYERALELDSGDFAAQVGLAVCLGNVGEIEDSLRQLEDVHAQTGHPMVLLERASVLVSCGRYAEAADQYRQLIELGLDEGALWNNYAECLAQTGQVDEALACFDRSIELEPGTPNAYFGKARSLVNAGRIEEAQQTALKMLAVSSEEFQREQACVALFDALGYAQPGP